MGKWRIFTFPSDGSEGEGPTMSQSGSWGPWRQENGVTSKKSEGEGPPQELFNIEAS